ncbi:LppX_LprAFG lipoprotein [Amycolatopsis magusensis]|uniref:LppX_LprAFG lipoprotein n=1 Tax=Amycolatopsis magusensis TaxID=882444 RepID=UPI0037A681B2
MLMRRILLGALALAVTATTGCSSDEPDTSSFPPAEQLVQEATAATSAIRSTHFSLQVNGSVTGLSVQSLDGDLTKEGGPTGAAKGTGKMEIGGELVEAEFVVVEDSFYLRGPTGSFRKIPAAIGASVYDPSAILDPQRGIAKLVSSLQNPKTEGEEDVDGTATWKVTGQVGKDVLVALLPGVQADAEVSFWLAKGTKLPVKATARFPDNASVDVKLSDVDKPVTVTPPA